MWYSKTVPIFFAPLGFDTSSSIAFYRRCNGSKTHWNPYSSFRVKTGRGNGSSCNLKYSVKKIVCSSFSTLIPIHPSFLRLPLPNWDCLKKNQNTLRDIQIFFFHISQKKSSLTSKPKVSAARSKSSLNGLWKLVEQLDRHPCRWINTRSPGCVHSYTTLKEKLTWTTNRRDFAFPLGGIKYPKPTVITGSKRKTLKIINRILSNLVYL